MSTGLRGGRHLRSVPESDVGRRAITFAGLSLSGIALGLLPVGLLVSEIAMGKF